jgi:hypothetical protein
VTDYHNPAWFEESRFRGALDDVIIIPLVFVALAANKILRFILSILMRLLDYAFPLAMQIVWLPLFAARVLGNVIVTVMNGALRMGVPKMPASHAEHRIARDPGRGTLAPHLFRGCNGDARGIVCQGHVLASLDAALASAGNGHRQEQAFGAAGVPGSLATGQKTSVRSARIQEL